jgi:hypothetical protein
MASLCKVFKLRIVLPLLSKYYVAAAAYQTTHPDETPISVTSLRTSSLSKIEEFLLQGDRRQAFQYAMDQKLWAHAMIIASSIDKDAWKEVVNDFLHQELTFSDEQARVPLRHYPRLPRRLGRAFGQHTVSFRDRALLLVNAMLVLFLAIAHIYHLSSSRIRRSYLVDEISRDAPASSTFTFCCDTTNPKLYFHDNLY